MSHDRHHRKFIPADYLQAIKYYRTGEQPMWPSSDEKREKPSFLSWNMPIIIIIIINFSYLSYLS